MELWGSHFMVISGGEPFTYESEGKGMLDIFEEFSDQFFLVYTNGTKLSPRVAERLGKLGNVTPAVSVEGLEAETDARRGRGTFAKILKAMENLRQAGVPFGVSATVTRATAEKILNDEFVEFFFEKQGALYSWVFQYMPIGRGYDVEMMLTPQQRVALLHRTWKLIREKEYFIADFWNCATASSGCIAAGGGIGGGYFYIDWNGNVAPCVFNPIFVDNIAEVFARGGDLNSVISSPLFTKVRCWQRDYFLDRPANEGGNLFAPCLMRDHHQQMRQIAAEAKAIPLDADTACAFQDAAYYQAMVQYGHDMAKLTHDLWRDFRDGQPSRESKRKSPPYQDKIHSGNEKRNSFQSQTSIPS
jgi:MoaA/NifB/PqqE/SkfB family radical SAM enzyme